MPAFQGLCSQDQQLLLEDAIPELLILTALQFRGSAAFHSLETQLKQFLSPTDFFKLDQVVKYIAGLNPPLNHLEVTSLKALLLFRPGLYFPSRNNSVCSLLSAYERVQRPDGRASGVHDPGSRATSAVRTDGWQFERISDSTSIRSTPSHPFNHRSIQSPQFPALSRLFL